jgi:recombination protein RecT
MTTTQVAPRQPQPIATIRKLLESSRDEIARALPSFLTPDRVIRVSLTLIQQGEGLIDCDPLSLVGAIMQAGSLGLELDPLLGQASLVPFWNNKRNKQEAKLMIGYKGFIALAHRSGRVERFGAHVVHAGDAFECAYGSERFLRHAPNFAEPGEPKLVYAEIATREGGYDFEVMTWPEILHFQKRFGHYASGKAKGQRKEGPWWTDLPEMAKKTCIKRLAKRVPISIDLQRATSLDEAETDVGELPGPVLDQPALDTLQEDANGSKPSATGPRATREQLALIWTLARRLPAEEVDYLCEQVGAQSPADLTAPQAAALLVHLEEAANQETPEEESNG